MKKCQQATHNIKQLGLSGLRGFGSRVNFFLGRYRRNPKTQPFHIVKRGNNGKKPKHTQYETD